MYLQDNNFDGDTLVYEQKPKPPIKIPKPDPNPFNYRTWLIVAAFSLFVLLGGMWLVKEFPENYGKSSEEAMDVVDTTAAIEDTIILEEIYPNTDNSIIDNQKKVKVGKDISQKKSTLISAQRAADEIAATMVLITGGTFMMGCMDEQDDDCSFVEKPAHKRSVSTFYINKFEVTQAQWKAIMGNNPSYFQNCDRCPVEQVSWNHAHEFIRKLNRLTGSSYRLPTEAEWEYAARGGQNYKYSGSNTISNVAWYEGNSGGRTHWVGQKSANGYGLYDMSGNVWEWCSDWYKRYPGSSGVGNYTAYHRMCRGGSWLFIASVCRVSDRNHTEPDIGTYFFGLRLAR